MRSSTMKSSLSFLPQRITSVAILLIFVSGCTLLNDAPAPCPDHGPVPSPVIPSPSGKLVNVSFYGGAGSNHKLSRYTASGERFNPETFSAAHRTLPFGTHVRLRDRDSGREVVVRINDRGPFIKNRELDISYAAARQLGIVTAGVKRVEMTVESMN